MISVVYYKNMEYKKISIIGAGAMGGAIIKALANHGGFSVTAINSSEEKLQDLFTFTLGKIEISTNYDSLKDAEVVVLAVKPQSFHNLASQIYNQINKDALVVSVMAGTQIKTVKESLLIKKVARSIPNLGAQFGESMTVWSGDRLEHEDKKFVKEFLQILGKEIFVEDEDMINKATAISGSGPGFFAYIVEAYAKEAEKLGFSAKDATNISMQTFYATAVSIKNENIEPSEFRERVTSKNGTTEAGLKVLMKKKLSKLIAKTFSKAYSRAKKISLGK